MTIDGRRLYRCTLASMLALDEYSQLKDRYEQQLELNKAAEQFAHQVCSTAIISLLMYSFDLATTLNTTQLTVTLP